MLDITKIPLDDEETWDLICDGNTKGVFQVESRLGKTWCRRMKPRNIEELAALSSAIRPGVLKAVEDGKSMTQHYSDRKNGTEEVGSLYGPIDHIVEATYAVILYQEQMLKISQEMAGFTKVDSEGLRKAAGKKDAVLMAKVRTQFIEGSVTEGHPQEAAERIFDILEKSARYNFNKSHAVSYSKTSYQTAYLKAHYPLLFYLEWMKKSDDKPEPKQEMRELIMSARGDGIVIEPPSINHISNEFQISEGSIYFGVTNVKNVGKRDYAKILELLPDEYGWDYLEILVHLLLRMNKRSAINLVKVGFCDGFGETRSTILHHLHCLAKSQGQGLSPRELDWLSENLTTEESLEFNLGKTSILKRDGGGTHNQKRSIAVLDMINKIENPGRSLQDTPEVYSDYEEELLGVPITYNRLDSCADAFAANTTCKEVLDGKLGPVIIACELMNHREYETKDKRIMCFLTIEDETSELESTVIFPDAYEAVRDIIYDKATLLLMGNVVNRNGQVSFIVEEASQI